MEPSLNVKPLQAEANEIEAGNSVQPAVLGNKVARLVPSQQPTEIRVQWESYPPTLARHLANIEVQELLGSEQQGREVLISFIDNDPNQPVIIGVLASVVDDMVQMELTSAEKPDMNNVISDGESVLISAEKQIVLVCGKSSLMLRKDGKIIAKGTNILSRASASNKVKGGSVEIN
jgi:hypothetical protein